MQEERTNIPAELQALPQWVCWGKPGAAKWKCPYNPRSGKMAKAGGPETWADFETAARAVAVGEYEGLGFEFATGGGLVGVDFDHCIQGGKLDPWAAAWVERLNSYTEISPSGTGLHVICRGKLPGEGVKRPRCEMYDWGRYLTVTGRPWGTARPLRESGAELAALYKELRAEADKGRDRPTPAQTTPAAPRMAPAGKDYLAIGLERDERFRALWDGLRPNGNESSDDLALMNKLAYWCNCDPAAMAAAWNDSPHLAGKDEQHQKKARRADYLARTIQRAVNDCPGTAAAADAAHRDMLAGDAFGRTEYIAPAKPPKLPPRLATISARELQDKDIDPVQFIVVGMLPRGLALLASPPKFGKSWLVLDMCLSVSAGRDFLGHETVKSGCLYLALEDSEGRLQDRMNKVLAGERAPEGFSYATTALDIGNGLLEQLAGYLKEHPGTGLVVVDTLQKVRASTGGKESAYSADYKEVGALKAFADKHGICLLLVHHLRKMKDETDPFNQISGTNGIFGAADTAMVLTRARRGDEQTTFSIIGRDIDSSDTVMVFDKNTYRWRVLGGLEVVEQERARNVYEESALVLTIRELIRQGGTGSWSGTMKDLMQAGEEIAHTWLADTTRALASQVKAVARQLFEYDHIIYRYAKNGTGSGKHHFHLSTVGLQGLTVGSEQTHME